MPRYGHVEMTFSIVADLDDPQMVEAAKELLAEDIFNFDTDDIELLSSETEDASVGSEDIRKEVLDLANFKKERGL